nr:unknown [Medicago truncatula]
MFQSRLGNAEHAYFKSGGGIDMFNSTGH